MVLRGKTSTFFTSAAEFIRLGRNSWIIKIFRFERIQVQTLYLFKHDKVNGLF